MSVFAAALDAQTVDGAIMDLVTSLWASRARVHSLFDLPHAHLDELVAQGFVKTAKMGSSRQSPRLFRIKDIDAALLAFAEGVEPARPKRQVKRKAVKATV